MKSNVAESVCEWAEKELGLPFTVFTDLIPDGDSDGACIRHDPAPAAEKRYSDGTRLVSWNLTLFVRCRDSALSRSLAGEITAKLDGAEIETEETKIECEATTLPQFIDTDAKGFTTYSASVKCTFLEE